MSGPTPRTPVQADGTKWCNACKRFKPASDFHISGKLRSGLKSYCAYCNKDSAFRRRYGITLATYEEMLANQRGLCALCGLPPTELRRGKVLLLVVDHDHATGQVRGLIHHQCNRLLGQANDSAEMLGKAVAYLEKAS